MRKIDCIETTRNRFHLSLCGRVHRLLFLSRAKPDAPMSAEASQKTLGPLIALLRTHDRRMAIPEEEKIKALLKYDIEASKMLEASDGNEGLPSGLMELALQQGNDHLEPNYKKVESSHEEHQHVETLRGKLRRRNELLDVIFRAYYHDVIVVKEELRRHQSISISSHPSALKTFMRSKMITEAFKQNGLASIDAHNITSESFLSSIPSVDLRAVLPLFAPADCKLKVNPCDLCGGTIELLHGEVHRCSHYVFRRLTILIDK